MRTRFPLTFLVTLLLLSVWASVASARTANVDDPADATPPLSGMPSNPDVTHVALTYDPAGALSMKVDFVNAVNALDRSVNYSMYGDFAIGTATVDEEPTCQTYGAGGVNGFHSVRSSGTGQTGSFSVVGFDGWVDFASTVSPDLRSITFSVSNPALANRNYNCVVYSLNTRKLSSIGVLESKYDVNCDCWYVYRTLDSVGDSGPRFARFFWFDDSNPANLPRVRSRMRFSPLVGCRRINLGDWEVTPDKVRGVERSYAGGRMVFDIRKRGVHRQKRLRVISGSMPEMRKIPPGRYRMKVWYTGDKYRRKSNIVRKTVRVKNC